jgi:hypothetical protein
MKRRTHVSQFTGNLLYEKREINMISRIHNDEMIRTGKINHTTNESVVKPLCIVDCNSNMGAVDNTDMQISFSECIRTTINCYK